jgi:hypothetical protein
MKRETMSCPVCKYRWMPRKEAPKQCPNPYCHAQLRHPITGEEIQHPAQEVKVP